MNDFVSGNSTNMSGMGNEASKQQSNCQHKNLEKFAGSASQIQLFEIDIHDKCRRVVDDAVSTFKKLHARRNPDSDG